MKDSIADSFIFKFGALLLASAILLLLTRACTGPDIKYILDPKPYDASSVPKRTCPIRDQPH